MSDYPVIPELPDPPLRTDGRVDFARKGSVFLGAFPAMRSAFNAAGAWVESAMATVLGYKQEAESASGNAQGYAGNAADSAQDSEQWAQQANAFAQVAATNANFAGNWDELSGAATVPMSVYWDGQYWQLLRNIPDVAASEPGQTTDWAGSQTEIIAWEPVTGNHTLASNGFYGVNGSPGQELTLPATPSNNDLITLYLRSGSFKGVTFKHNGNAIMGSMEDLNVDSDIVGLQLIFAGTEWRIVR